MQIYMLSTFSKKLNSTKRPEDDGLGSPFSVKLKAGTSVINPVFELANKSGDWTPSEYTYVYVPSFNHRYYFINDWVCKPGYWEIHCSVDVLASHKDRIVGSSQFVARANVAKASNVLDTAPLMLTTSSEQTVSANERSFNGTYENGFFVVGVITPEARFGCCEYYVFENYQNLGAFIDKLFSNATYANVTDVSDELMKNLSNPMQYITSCTFYPYSITKITRTAVSSVKLGFWDIGVSAHRLADYSHTESFSIEIPKHPQTDVVGTFANLAPYSNYTFELQPFGTMPLDPVKLVDATNVNGEMVVDLLTGEAMLHLYCNDGTYIGVLHAQVGVDTPIAARASTIEGIVGSVVATGVSATVSRFFEESEIANKLSGACNAIAGSLSNVITKGTQKARALIGSYALLHAHFQDIETSYVNLIGRAVSKTMSLHLINGFAQIIRPKIDDAGISKIENDEICRYMESGFYIE